MVTLCCLQCKHILAHLRGLHRFKYRDITEFSWNGTNSGVCLGGIYDFPYKSCNRKRDTYVSWGQQTDTSQTVSFAFNG
jgi:hypothetical protein